MKSSSASVPCSLSSASRNCEAVLKMNVESMKQPAEVLVEMSPNILSDRPFHTKKSGGGGSRKRSRNKSARMKNQHKSAALGLPQATQAAQAQCVTKPATELLVTHLPHEVLAKILTFCDRCSLQVLSRVCRLFRALICQHGLLHKTPSPNIRLDQLPSEVLLQILSHLDWPDLGRVAVVSRRFRDLSYADCLWKAQARKCLVTNGLDTSTAQRNVMEYSSLRDRVRIGRNWSQGTYWENTLLVQNVRYMPRLQLFQSQLWVSWGNKIWSHPRLPNGTISRTTNRVLKGHTDDVARFVVKEGLVVSGGRDRSLFGWHHQSGEFAFAKRYCHGGEVSAVDVSPGGHVIISGSRDRTVKIWSLNVNNAPNLLAHNYCCSNVVGHKSKCHKASSSVPHLAGTVDIGDRIWSLAANPFGSLVAIGSAGLCGVPSLHLLDVNTRQPTMQLGRSLKRGAGMLDLTWLTDATFLSCGYDSFTRLWDTRVGGDDCVRSWEEPFDEAIYCLATDNHVTLVCGTARHGLVRLWDMRHSSPVQMFYTKHAHAGQSSPVYSVAFDMAHLYVALDQCLSLITFDRHPAASNPAAQ